MIPLILVLIALSQTSCSTLRSEAITEFSTAHSCPGDRLSVKQVSVRGEDLLSPGTPPDEVAADPGRLAVWQKNQKGLLVRYTYLTVVDITGCDVHNTYLCRVDSSGGDDVNPFVCSVVNLEDPNARLVSFSLNPSAVRSLRERLDAAPVTHP